MSDLVRLNSGDPPIIDILQQRAKILNALRNFFAGRGFLEVETPILCYSPGVEAHLSAFETYLNKKKMYLITSPEFHMKRLLSAGFSKVFQVTKAFRTDENGRLHNPEFTMVEWYRVNCNYTKIMEDCEELVEELTYAIHKSPIVPEVEHVRASLCLEKPFKRITFRDAFIKFANVDPIALSREDRDRILSDQVAHNLGKDKPIFLVDFPADQGSLGLIRDGEYAERFELYIDGVEIANGFTEITDVNDFLDRCKKEQEERERLGLSVYPIDQRYIQMLEEGLPPCAGVALGFDRLVMMICGAKDIKHCMAFPIEYS